jgi:hypothetical protein
LQAFFGVHFDSTYKVTQGFTPPQAVLNLLVLTACICIVLYSLDRYLHWQEGRA